MKLPKDITGKNKLRDLRICTLYCAGKSIQEIKDECYPNLSLRRLYDITYNNPEFINKRITWPKSKRIHLLQRIAVQAGSHINSKKDILDVLSELRKEIEGDKPLVDMSKHEHITIVVDSTAAKEEGFEIRPELQTK
jgi:hypothetical protein